MRIPLATIRFHKVGIAASGAALALLLSACGGTSDDGPTSESSADPSLQSLLPDEVRESGTLHGGSSLTTPPLYTFAEDGKTASGVLIELIDAAADRLGVTIDWAQMPYGGIVPALNSGKIDISGSQFSATAANLEAASVLTIFQNTVGLVVPENEKGQYGDLAGACGTKIAVVRGSSPETLALEKINQACEEAGEPAATSLAFAGTADELVALKAGRVDSIIMSLAPATYNAENESSPLAVVLGGEFDSVPAGFIFKKDSIKLAEAFKAAFASMIKDGTYAKIMEKWNMPKVLFADSPALNEATG